MIREVSLSEQERHNRRVMIQRIKSYWLKGVLEESLHGAELIDLSMSDFPGALASGQHSPDAEYDMPLPMGTQSVDVFDRAQGGLLILGAPGAGKTTTLLQLVTSLVQRAELDERQPVPVVLSLATWLDDQPLSRWMVTELSHNYEVPRQLGQEWLGEGQLLPLLDGLDEVEQSHRESCAQAINQWCMENGHRPLVVTTRLRDYKALPLRLDLSRAIVLQPLSLEQIDIYLGSVGKRLAGLRAAIHSDATLRELAQSPLMLSIMTLAYYRMPADIAVSLGEQGMSRQHLFDVYVERMARYRDGEKIYPLFWTNHWLSWLARQMSQSNQTIFFLERLQPAWLLRSQRRRYASQLRFGVWLVLALSGLLGGLIGWVTGTPVALLWGMALGLVGAGLSRLWGVLGWPTLDGPIETVETLKWSWPHAMLSLLVGGLAGAGLGALVNWIAPESGVAWLPLLALSVGIGAVLRSALFRNEMKLRTTPGQGLVQSRQNGLWVGGLVAVGTAVTTTLATLAAQTIGETISLSATLPWIAGFSLYLGLTGGLVYGGLAYWQHRLLLRHLQQNKAIPFNFINFLDYAAERSLLRKVGGGYMFGHALLLDYFACRSG
jgi:hypothetical protein